MAPRQRRRGRGNTGPKARPSAGRRTHDGRRGDDAEDVETESEEGSSYTGSSESDVVERILDDAEVERFWIPEDAPRPDGEVTGASKSATNWSCLMIMIFFAVATVVLRISEEDYERVKVSSNTEEDHYATLGITRSSSNKEVKRAYKELALKWHPDKNRGCEECEARFRATARAYEVLSHPLRRQSYDQVLGDAEPIPSAASTSLTEAKYREEVLGEADIWVIQVFSELDDACAAFAPHWERVAEELRSYARFGRINSHVDRQVVQLLPMKARMNPTVLILPRGFQPAMFPQQIHGAAGKLKRWVLDNIPESVRVLTSATEVDEFVTSRGTTLKFIVLSERAGGASHLLRRAAIQLRGQASIAQAKPEFAQGLEGVVESHQQASVRVLVFPHGGSRTALRSWSLPKKDAGGSGIQQTLRTAIQTYAAPALHRHNVKQLCSAQTVRLFCVCLLDFGAISTTSFGSLVSVWLAALRKSAVAHHKTVQLGEEQNTEAEIQIQVVRLVTRAPSVFDSEFTLNVEDIKPFKQVLEPLLAGALSFVLDLDAHRIAPLLGTHSDIEAHLSVLHESIATGVLNFQPMPLQDVREALREPDAGIWLEMLRWLRSASYWQLLGVMATMLIPWAAFHFLNLQRFMLIIVALPILTACLSNEFLWLLKQYWSGED